VRNRRRNVRRYPRLEGGNWGATKRKSEFTPIRHWWKIGILGIIIVLGVLVPAAGYYYWNVVPQQAQASNQNRDPFTLLWNGTTPRAVPHGSGPIAFNSKVNATCAVSCGGSPVDTVLLFPSLTVNVGDTILLAFYASHSIVATFTVKDSQLNSYTQQVSSKHTGLDTYIYTALAISSGGDILNLTSSAQNAFAGVVSDYSGGITFGNTASDFGSTNSLSATSTVTLTVAATSSFVVEFMASGSTGGTGTITPASSQILRNEYSTAAAQSSASGDTDITGVSGSTSLGLTLTFTSTPTNWNHVALELVFNSAFSSASACPAGYQCLFSSTDPNGNIQLNAKPAGPSTLDSYHPTPDFLFGTGNVSQSPGCSGCGFFAGETFTISGASWQISSVQFLMNKTNNWSGAFVAQIWNIQGIAGTNGLPLGTAPSSGAFPQGSLITSLPLANAALLPTNSTAIPITFTFPLSPTLSAGNYVVTLTTNSSIAQGASPLTGNGLQPIPHVLVQLGVKTGGLAGHNSFRDNGIVISNGRNFWFTITGSPASAVALTSSPIDVATSASKELLFYETWHNTTGITSSPWGWYLTVNSTLPTQANYNPLNDPSVVMADILYPTGPSSATKNYYNYQAKTPGQQLGPVSAAGTNPYPSCPQTATLYICASSNGAYASSNFQAISTVENYTGSAAPGGNNGFSLYCVDAVPGPGSPTTNPFCSSTTQTPTLTPCTGTLQDICATQTLPFLNINAGPYYLGFWASSGQNGTILFGTSKAGGSDEQANSIYYWVPNPTAATPATTDTGGFFGWLGKTLGGAYNAAAGALSPITGPILNAGNSMMNAVAAALIQSGNLLIQGLGILEGLVVSTLNIIGNAGGLGNVGTIIQNLISQFILFFTNQVPTLFTNLPSVFSRFFDTLSITFPWLPNALTTAQSVLLFGVKAIAFIPTIVGFAFMFVSGAFATYFIAFWFIYTGDDSLAGILALFETSEFLVFGLGIRYLAIAFNYAEDIILAIVGLIPKPLIQMATLKIPRLPIVEVNARFVWPGGSMSEIRNGNLFTVACWVTGVLFLDFYETASPALPGSIGFLLPSAASSLVPLSGFIPLLEIMTAFAWGASFLMMPIGWFANAVDLGSLPFESAVGTKISGGFGGIQFQAGKRHFTGRAEKIQAKREGVKTEAKVKESGASSQGVG